MPPYLRETEEKIKTCQESRIIVAYDATVWQEVEVCFFQLSARAIGRPRLSMFCQALIYLFGISFGNGTVIYIGPFSDSLCFVITVRAYHGKEGKRSSVI